MNTKLVNGSEKRTGEAAFAGATGSDAPLTPEQIEHWRNTLCGMMGPYALIMPAADIQKYKDIVQRRVLGHPNDGNQP